MLKDSAAEAGSSWDDRLATRHPLQVVRRIVLIFVVLAGFTVAAFFIDVVHSDPGVPIEDFWFVAAAMAVASFFVFRPERVLSKQILPIFVFLCLTIIAAMLARDQYHRTSQLKVDGVSLFFPGLYFPRDSFSYTFTALVETTRPKQEVERDVLQVLTSAASR